MLQPNNQTTYLFNAKFPLLRLSPLSGRFYIMQFIGLVVSAVVFLIIFRDGQVDIHISQLWFDTVSGSFPFKDNYWLELFNHRLLKYLIILFSACTLLWGIGKKQADYLILALLLAIGALVIGILKQNSIHSCPWSLSQFGGHAAFIQLFADVPINTDTGDGQCFPGGHASAGFGLMALFFWFYPRKTVTAWVMWCCAVILGLAMGFGQLVRGAHFFSHNLWSGWWVWASQVTLYYLISQFFITKSHHIGAR